MTETPQERRDRWRSIGVVGQRSRDRVIEEGRAHPDSGKPYRTIRDAAGNDVTEHGTPGSGVSDRQDVNIRVPKPIEVEL